MLKFFRNPDYKALIKVPATWIIVSTVLVLLLTGLITKHIFSTELIPAQITETYYVAKSNVYVWSTVRNYDRSYAPSCSWDINKDTYQVCDARDTLGNCTQWHWETDYDYSIRTWKFFKSVTDTLYRNLDVRYPRPAAFNNTHKYKIEDSKVSFYIVAADTSEKQYTFKIPYKKFKKRFVSQRGHLKKWKATGIVSSFKELENDKSINQKRMLGSF